MYDAVYARPASSHRLEVCSLRHAGPLPAPWLATGFVVNLVLEGQADLKSRGAVQRVGSGHVVLANPGQLRAVTRRYSETAITRSVTIDPGDLVEALRDRSRRTGSVYFEQATTADVPLRASLIALYRALDDPSATQLTTDSAAEALFDGLDQVLLGAPICARWPTHPSLRRVREYIEDYVDRDLGLDELSRVAGLSRAHLTREFQRQVGLPPHQYQIHARVRRGRQLLAEGRTVAEVAVNTGFFDQAHFARHFRRLVGVSAIQYQRSVRQKPATTERASSSKWCGPRGNRTFVQADAARRPV